MKKPNTKGVMYLRRVPPWTKAEFKKACQDRGISMERRMAHLMMRDVIRHKQRERKRNAASAATRSA